MYDSPDRLGKPDDQADKPAVQRHFPPKRKPKPKAKTQSYKAAVAARWRRVNALRLQHRLRPFTHVAELLPARRFDESRFRSRLSHLNPAGIFSVWQREVAAVRAKGNVPHYHVLFRTATGIEAVRQYVADALPDHLTYNLNIRELDPDPEEVDRAFIYASKAGRWLIRKIKPQRPGERSLFAVGGPFNVDDLAAAYWRDEMLLRVLDIDEPFWIGSFRDGAYIEAKEPIPTALPDWFWRAFRPIGPGPLEYHGFGDPDIDAFLARCLADGTFPQDIFRGRPDDPESPI